LYEQGLGAVERSRNGAVGAVLDVSEVLLESHPRVAPVAPPLFGTIKTGLPDLWT
jgi:hypothetical protein